MFDPQHGMATPENRFVRGEGIERSKAFHDDVFLPATGDVDVSPYATGDCEP
jgi:hypothetical protein